jgi:hypothetical protein
MEFLREAYQVRQYERDIVKSECGIFTLKRSKPVLDTMSALEHRNMFFFYFFLKL